MLQLLLRLERGMGSWPCQEHALVLAQHLYLQQIRHPEHLSFTILICIRLSGRMRLCMHELFKSACPFAVQSSLVLLPSRFASHDSYQLSDGSRICEYWEIR